MASSKRYVFYRVKSNVSALEDWSVNDPVDPVVRDFVAGNLKAGRSSDDLDSVKDEDILLDTETGKLCVQVFGERYWKRPECSCPDCDGDLVLWKKFFKVGNPASPWFYICTNRDDGCKSVMPANKGGDMSGQPADAETRKARKLTTQQFDRLWQEAPDILEWAGDPEDRKAVVNKAKARAYRFLAETMSDLGYEKNIQKMDIPTLRVAYKTCRDADVNDIMKY